MNTQKENNKWLIIAVTLGYFVDLYDLLLFSSVRIASLKDMGIPPDLSMQYGDSLLNITVIGMLVGAIAWGVIADRKGRLVVLFGSIITYTLANFVNAFVPDILTYKICRFIAGFGIAGEFGVGVTLVSELLPNDKRSYAVMLISAIGMLGAATAGLLAFLLKDIQVFGVSSWRFLFIVGGVFGLGLLYLRTRTKESPIFEKSKALRNRGNIWFLVKKWSRLKKFLCSFLVGTPIFFIIGAFIGHSAEYGKLEGLDSVQVSLAICVCYISIAIFDAGGMLLSKRLKSRKRVIFIFLILQLSAMIIFLYVPTNSLFIFYAKVALLALSIGNWGVIVVNAAEQFGTNLRATVTTFVPNAIRGSFWPLSLLLGWLSSYIGIREGGAIIGLLTIVIALITLWPMEDNFEKDFDYEEA